MATELQFMDSFDAYATAERTDRWTEQVDVWDTGATNHFAITPSAMCNGVNGLRLSVPASALTSNEGTLRRSFTANAYVVHGFSFRFDVGLGHGIAAVMDGSSTQCQVVLNANGTISVKRGASSAGVDATTLATTDLRLPASAFYFIELYWRIHDTLGRVDLWIDNYKFLTLTGTADDPISTQATANATANKFAVGLIATNGATTAATWDWDNCYVLSSARSTVKPYGIGAATACHALDGNGARADFTPNVGTDHGNRVKDVTQDGDVTTNVGTAQGAADTYSLANVSTRSPIKGVQTTLVARHTAAADNVYVSNVFRIGGVDYTGTSMATTIAYQQLLTQYDVSPATGVPFTQDELNALEGGIGITG